jgi:hypothetical protein
MMQANIKTRLISAVMGFVGGGLASMILLGLIVQRSA